MATYQPKYGNEPGAWQKGYDFGIDQAREEMAEHGPAAVRETRRLLHENARTEFERGQAAGYEAVWGRRETYHATKPACTVAKYLMVLEHELVRYDMTTSAREAKRGHVNIYRLPLLLEALGRVRRDVGSRTTDGEADKAAFRMAMYQHFEKDFPPVKKVVKQLEAGTCKIK